MHFRSRVLPRCIASFEFRVRAVTATAGSIVKAEERERVAQVAGRDLKKEKKMYFR
jgi:hypothetical protein